MWRLAQKPLFQWSVLALAALGFALAVATSLRAG